MDTPTLQDLSARAADLRKQIQYHDHRYYIEADPDISDREYDALYTELKQIEFDHPELVTADSPTQRMHGGVSTGFVTVRHSVPMLSLENTYNTADLARFHESVLRGLNGQTPVYVIEPKIDGISIALRYENGVLVQALTRGNGKEGDDVTANIRTIPSIPLRLRGDNPPAFFEARGECYMPRGGFQLLNNRRIAEGLEPFANARNATAGSVKLLDSGECASRPLDVLFYTQGQLSDDLSITSQRELFLTFEKFGLKIQKWLRTARDFEGICQAIRELDEARKSFPYDTDGAVIKVDDFAMREVLGFSAKAPCWAKAYKFEPERAETRLKAITIQVGRTGVLTPVAELEPVYLSGSTISRATLHNEDEIARLDIRVGDIVRIEKAGEVIPAVIGVVRERRSPAAQPFDFSGSLNHRCPSCGEAIRRAPGEVAWRCENLQCPAQNVRRVEYFSARNALDIEGVGGVVAEALCEQNLIREPLDLYQLRQERLAILNLGSEDEPRLLGPKNAAKIIAALQAAKGKPLGNWLQAMGIPEVGSATAYQLGKIHTDLQDLRNSEILRMLLDLLDYQNGLKPTRSLTPATTAEASSPATPEPSTAGLELFDFAAAHPQQPPESQAVFDYQGTARRLLQLELIRPSSAKGGLYVTTSIGPKTASAVLDFFASPIGIGWLERLSALGISPKGGEALQSLSVTQDTVTAGGPLAGKSFVLTGTLTSMDRESAAEKIRALGGKVAAAVSRNTTYLVAGANTGARKTEKAAELGIAVIDEEAFLKMLDTPGFSSITKN